MSTSAYIISTAAHLTGLLLNALLLGVVVAKGDPGRHSHLQSDYWFAMKYSHSQHDSVGGLAFKQAVFTPFLCRSAASLPSAKMVFSNVICVRMRNGIQQLMVRVGNARGNILYSPDIRFAYGRSPFPSSLTPRSACCKGAFHHSRAAILALVIYPPLKHNREILESIILGCECRYIHSVTTTEGETFFEVRLVQDCFFGPSSKTTATTPAAQPALESCM